MYENRKNSLTEKCDTSVNEMIGTIASHPSAIRVPPTLRKVAFYNRSRSDGSILTPRTEVWNESEPQSFQPNKPTAQNRSLSCSLEDLGFDSSADMKRSGDFGVPHQHYRKNILPGCSSITSSSINWKKSELFSNKEAFSRDNQPQPSTLLSWRRLHLSRAKLKAANSTSALLAGFAMVAVVEIQFNGSGEKLPSPLLIMFAVCTTLLVGVHMLALLISTCILPNMEAIANLHSMSLVHESPHDTMYVYIELAWGCSTVLGMLLFMLEVIILSWIQFYPILKEAAYVATAILLPFVVLFILFAIIFYRRLVTHSYETRKCGIKELEDLKHVLEIDEESTRGHIVDIP